ncbi:MULTISPECIES: hypothetical protein [Gelidibacter]|uniref:HTH-type transcriptional regulator/antitoxin HigA n=1 Tax=Gelidibacter pelagius TaxID=2819985 RepID=A0ABS3SX06_9FLAO|nr:MULTISPECIES: hypothetical protein [Gelidibacter]MBO3100255.1 hypothetical protein [Gelidibacter pelagius]
MKLVTHKECIAANIRLEALLKKVGNDTLEDAPQMKELLEVSDLIEHYEEIYFNFGLPFLQEMVELRMFEMGLKS